MVKNQAFELTFPDYSGRHNEDIIKSANRLRQQKSYKDLSTICVIPNNGLISARVAEKWMGQVSQMNQKFVRLMMIGMEKYYGFNSVIEQILATPGLNKFKYILTLEEDMLPPIDGLIKLFESIEKYDVVGGLIWSKGIEGYPYIYGYPNMIPQAFMPVPPFLDTIQECLGLGTGFTLFKMDVFKDIKVTRPWFTPQLRNEPGKKPPEIDLSFFRNINKLGYKVACDTRVKVGHYDAENDIVW
jgi:hypothetical protein